MKRAVYVSVCVFLGLLAATIVHGVVEQWYIGLLIDDFATYSFGLSWGTWYTVHHVASALLWLLGAVLGYFLGVHWWRVVYVERKRGLVLGAE